MCSPFPMNVPIVPTPDSFYLVGKLTSCSWLCWAQDPMVQWSSALVFVAMNPSWWNALKNEKFSPYGNPPSTFWGWVPTKLNNGQWMDDFKDIFMLKGSFTKKSFQWYISHDQVPCANFARNIKMRFNVCQKKVFIVGELNL